MTERRFCSVPGCVEDATVSVLFAYAPDRGRVFLCDRHSRAVRRHLVTLWNQRESVDQEWHPIRGDEIVVFGPTRQ